MSRHTPLSARDGLLAGLLLDRHPAATISPMALLVPVFGIGAAALLLDEPLQPRKLAATALVLGGLAVNFCGPLWCARTILRRPGP